MDVLNVGVAILFTGCGKCLNVPKKVINIVVLIVVGRKELLRIVSNKINITTNNDGA